MSIFIEQQYQQALSTGIDIKLPAIAEVLVDIHDELLKYVDEVLGY